MLAGSAVWALVCGPDGVRRRDCLLLCWDAVEGCVCGFRYWLTGESSVGRLESETASELSWKLFFRAGCRREKSLSRWEVGVAGSAFLGGGAR